MSICGSVLSWLFGILVSVWESIFYPLYNNIGALSLVLFAFALNLIYIYFLGRFIQSHSQSDGIRRKSPKKSDGGEE